LRLQGAGKKKWMNQRDLEDRFSCREKLPNSTSAAPLGSDPLCYPQASHRARPHAIKQLLVLFIYLL